MFSKRTLSPAQVAAADQAAAQITEHLGAQGVIPVTLAGRHGGKLQVGNSAAVMLVNGDGSYDLVCIRGGRMRLVANQVAGEKLAEQLAWHAARVRPDKSLSI